MVSPQVMPCVPTPHQYVPSGLGRNSGRIANTAKESLGHPRKTPVTHSPESEDGTACGSLSPVPSCLVSTPQQENCHIIESQSLAPRDLVPSLRALALPLNG